MRTGGTILVSSPIVIFVNPISAQSLICGWMASVQLSKTVFGLRLPNFHCFFPFAKLGIVAINRRQFGVDTGLDPGAT
jgi:hypothetical protein